MNKLYQIVLSMMLLFSGSAVSDATGRYCVDVLPPNLGADTTDAGEAIARIGAQWPQSAVITVRFMGGTEAERARVIDGAEIWAVYTNLSFVYTDEFEADIRISFEPDIGSWSQIGRFALAVPYDQATMNFGWDITNDMPTIYHEWGHALSLGHEHQNPKGGIQWNEKVVLAKLAGAPNFWPEAKARQNVLSYSLDLYKGTEYDEFSIMLYFFPDFWTLNGVGSKQNNYISVTDKAYMRKLYPPNQAAANDESWCGSAYRQAVGMFNSVWQ